MPDGTDRIRRIYDRTARWYDVFMRASDRILFGNGRSWIGAHAQGAVLEVGVGTGRNLRHYRAATRITGVDVSEAMLRIARRRARELERDAELVAGDAEALAFPDERFDTVAFSLALCSIPHPDRAVREAVRVLRPGGSVVALEHVRSDVPAVRLVQRVIEPLSVRLLGEHLLREPTDYFGDAGLVLECVIRTRWGIVERALARRAGGS